MTGSVHNHPIAHSNASLRSEDRDDLASHSGIDSIPHGGHREHDWPATSSTTSSNSSIGHGFDAVGAATRGANLSRRASTHAASTDATSSGAPRVRRRTLNGTETRPELIEIIADMHEEMRGLARELHDARRDQQDPAARQRTQLRNQERLQRQTERHQTRKMDRERARMQREEEFEEFKTEHEQRMKEMKINNMLDKEEMQEAEMEIGLSVEAGSKALQIINRGL